MPAPKSGARPFASTPEMKLSAILFVPVVAGVMRMPAAESLLLCRTMSILFPVTRALLTSLPPLTVVLPHAVSPPSEMPKTSPAAALMIPPIALSVIWMPSSKEAMMPPFPRRLAAGVLFSTFFVMTVPVSLLATLAPEVAIPY